MQYHKKSTENKFHNFWPQYEEGRPKRRDWETQGDPTCKSKIQKWLKDILKAVPRQEAAEVAPPGSKIWSSLS